MGNRIYVGNLSFNTSTQDLRAAFESCGNVTDAKVMTDRETGQSRGFGFVTFSSDTEAQAAIAQWNGQDLQGRSLRVNEAEDRPQRTGGGGGGGGSFRGGGGGGGGDRGGGGGGGRDRGHRGREDRG